MMKILKLIAASAASLLAAGCVAVPYDDGYNSGYYGGGGYAYSAPPAVAYAPPAVSFQYYDYDARPRVYREYHEDHYVYRNDGRNWHGDGRNYHRDGGHYDRRTDARDHRDHRYWDGH